jgi:N-acyl amino acid synthase of PEP-CTERM/exosortase system
MQGSRENNDKSGKSTSMVEDFLQYFDIDLATTEAQKQKIYNVRYRVYCEEFKYEPVHDKQGEIETDEFDDHSLHCLVTHKRSGRAAGCVRLVCASDDHVLPLENHCLENVYVDYLDPLMAGDRNQLCEFSRLAVDAAFRKRPGEEHTRLGEFDAMDCSHQEQRTFSLVGIASFLAAFAAANLAQRDQIYAMMESNLPRLLRRAGILVQKAGDTMEYHGPRAPYFITTELALNNMRDDLHGLYDAIHERLAYSYNGREAAKYINTA